MIESNSENLTDATADSRDFFNVSLMSTLFRHASLRNVNSVSLFNHLIPEIPLPAYSLGFDSVAELFCIKMVTLKNQQCTACKNMRFVICCNINEVEN